MADMVLDMDGNGKREAEADSKPQYFHGGYDHGFGYGGLGYGRYWG